MDKKLCLFVCYEFNDPLAQKGLLGPPHDTQSVNGDAGRRIKEEQRRKHSEIKT